MKKTWLCVLLFLVLGLIALLAGACASSSSSSGGAKPVVDDDDNDDSADDDNDSVDDDDDNDDDNDSADDDDDNDDDNDSADDDDDNDDDNDSADDDDDNDDDNDSADDDDDNDDDNDSADDDDDNDNDDDNDTVESVWTDPTTGYMWQNGAEVGQDAPIDAADAQTYCANLTWASETGWHLPSIDELRTLIRECAATETGGSCGVTDSCLDASCADLTCAGCNAFGGPGANGTYLPPELTGSDVWIWSSSAVADVSGNQWRLLVILADIDEVTGAGLGGARCVRNVCNPTSCPNGCCDASGVCNVSGDGTCGVNGAACVACGATTICTAGSCVTGCDPTNCPTGCCNGTSCVNPPIDAQCGTNGASCIGCGAGTGCVNGACVTETAWPDVSSGLTWQNGPTVGSTTLVLGDAQTYCANLTWAGDTGWRLPSIDELRTLIRGCAATETGGSCTVTDSCPGCWNDPCFGCTAYEGGGNGGDYTPAEIIGAGGIYWSATANGGSWEEGVDLDNAAVSGFAVGTAYGARCVRDSARRRR